jgi:hypothetical protein
MLKSIVNSLDDINYLEQKSTGNTSGVEIWILEQESMFLVASSDHEPIVTDSGVRVLAKDSLNPIVRKGSLLLGNGETLQGRKQDLVIESGENVFIVSSFRLSGNSSWSIIIHVPAETFRRSLNEAYRISIPLVTFSVLFVSIVISVLVTRCLGRQLLDISNQMLDISNINFSGNPHEPSCLDGFQVNEIKKMKEAMFRLQNGMSALSKYAPIEVVQILMRLGKEARLGVEERELSVNHLLI